jgi:hypothetical protein
MRRSRVWASRVEWTVAGQYWTHTEWDSKRAGRATDANLARFVRETVDSFKPGGVNARSGEVGGVPQVLVARVVSQCSGKVLATYAAVREVVSG